MGLAKNSFLYLISNIAIKATSFFLLPFYSYLVPPEVYGHVYVVSALSNFMVVLLPFSMHICISRFFFDCKNLEEVKRLYSTIVLFVFVSATILIVPMAVMSTRFADIINIPHSYFIVGLCISYFNIFYQIILALLYACQNAKKVSITSMCIGICQMVLQLILVITMDDKGVALLSTMFIQSLTTFIIFLIYSRPYLVWSFDFNNTNKLLKYSLSQFPSDVSGWLVNFTDRILINKYISPASAGIYGIGANIGSIPMMIFSSVNSAFTPYVNSQYKAMELASPSTLMDVKKNLSHVFMVVSSCMMMMVSVLIVLSNNIVSLLSPVYANAFLVVVVMLISSLMNNYRIMYMAPLAYNVKYTKIKSFIWVVAGIVNIVLNLILIPRYGIYAACINSLITYTITFLLMLYYGKKAIYMKYEWSILLKVLLISALFAFSLFLGNSVELFFMKVILVLPYSYISFRYIIKINVYSKFYNYVKVFCHK